MLPAMLVRVHPRIRVLCSLLILIAVASLLVPVYRAGGQQVGNFILSVSPPRVTIGTDGTGQYSVRLTSVGGFAGTIKLDVTDVSAISIQTSFAFQPSVVDLAVDSDIYSVLTMIAQPQSSQYPSYYTLYTYAIDFKVRATGGGLTNTLAAGADILYGSSTTSNLQYADIAINLQPNTVVTSGDITQGKSQNLKISVYPRATLTVGELLFTSTPQFYDIPGGLYISFNPSSVDVKAAQTSEITATVLMTPEFLQKSGTYRLVIGISGTLQGPLLGISYGVFITKTAILTIIVPPFFNIAVMPSIVDVYIGGQDQKLQITVTPISRGLNQPINLGVDGIPPGIVASFERDTLIPKGVSTLSTNLLLNAPSTTMPGVFPIRISATTLGTTRITNATLNLRPTGDYTISLDQTLVSLSGKGESRSVTLTIRPQGGFKSTIDFTVTNLPRGVGATLSTSRATIQQDSPISVVLTISALQDIEPGTFDIAIVANTGFSTKTVDITLVVRSGSAQMWPVVLVVFIVIAVISVIVFAGVPRRRQVRVRRDIRYLPR